MEERTSTSNIEEAIQDPITKSNTGVVMYNTDRGNVDNTGDDALLDTAWNVKTIRDMKGRCVVKKMHCIVHDKIATRTTRKQKVWTRIPKTGLFGYRTRKVSVVACSGHTPTLVATMDRPVSGGDVTESGGELAGCAGLG